MTQQINSASETAIRNELEQFIQTSGNDVNKQMQQARTTMDLYFMHGQWACLNDLPEKAIRSLMTCLKLEPNAPLVHSALSRIHLTRGDLAKADRHARRALELQPKDFKCLLTCHLIVSKLGRDHMFEDRLAMAIRLRLSTSSEALGKTAPAWPWGRKDVAPAWAAGSLQKASAEFKSRKYTVLRGVMPAGWPELLLAEQAGLLARGTMSLEAVMHRRITADAPLASIANYETAALVSRILGHDVIPTYAFAIHYLAQGHIKPHTDRPQNELSMSLGLAVTPPAGDISVLRAGTGGAMERVDLEPNDALLYRGAEVLHARDPVPEGHTVDQAIFGFRTVNKSHCYCT